MFNLRLKVERERLGLTQPQFAALADVKKGTQINWERGDSSPTATQLCRLFLSGVDVIYVLTGMRLPSEVFDKLAAMMRLTIEIEPNGGPLTDKAMEAIRAEGSLISSEQALLANYRASSNEGKQALETAAKVMADKATGDKTKGS